MSGPEFKLGSQVILKSGGPTMTIARHLRSEGKLVCVWYDQGSSSFKEFAFNPIALKPATGDSDSTDGEPENGALV